MILKYIDIIKYNINKLSIDIKNDMFIIDNLNNKENLNIYQQYYGGVKDSKQKKNTLISNNKYDSDNNNFILNMNEDIKNIIDIYKQNIINNNLYNLFNNISKNISYEIKNLNHYNFVEKKIYENYIKNNYYDKNSHTFLYKFLFKKDTYLLNKEVIDNEYKDLYINQGFDFSDIYKFLLIKNSNLFNDDKQIKNDEIISFIDNLVNKFHNEENPLIKYIHEKKNNININKNIQYKKDFNAYNNYINNINQNDIMNNNFLYDYLCNKTKYIDIIDNINIDKDNENDIYNKISILNFVELNNDELDKLINKLKRNFNYLLFTVLYVFNNNIYEKINNDIKYIIDLYDDDIEYNYTHNSENELNLNYFFKILLIKYTINNKNNQKNDELFIKELNEGISKINNYIYIKKLNKDIYNNEIFLNKEIKSLKDILENNK